MKADNKKNAPFRNNNIRIKFESVNSRFFYLQQTSHFTGNYGKCRGQSQMFFDAISVHLETCSTIKEICHKSPSADYKVFIRVWSQNWPFKRRKECVKMST